MTETETPPPEVVAPPPNPFAKWNTEFRIIEEEITVSEALRRRKPGFKERWCILNMGSLVAHWEGKFPIMTSSFNFMDQTLELGKAQLVQTKTITDRPNNWGSCCILLLDEEALKKEPPTPKFNLETMVNPTIIALAKAAPLNPVLRSHLVNIFGSAPPAEAVTYEQIKHWAECNFQFPNVTGPNKVYGIPENRPQQQLGGQLLQQAVERAAQANTFNIPVRRNMRTYGTCRYHEKVYREGLAAFTLDEIRQLLGAGGLSRTVEMLQNVAPNRCASFGEVQQYEEEDVDYDRHTQEGSEDTGRNVDYHGLDQQLRDFIRRNYGPEEASQIINH